MEVALVVALVVAEVVAWQDVVVAWQDVEVVWQHVVVVVVEGVEGVVVGSGGWMGAVRWSWGGVAGPVPASPPHKHTIHSRRLSVELALPNGSTLLNGRNSVERGPAATATSGPAATELLLFLL